MTQAIANKLERARLILSAAQGDPELAARLAQVGYDAAALQAGQALYEASGGARTAAHAAHGDQLGATETVETLRRRVEANHTTLAQIARTAFAGDADALATLGLAQAAGRRSRSQATFLDRARVLYDAALADPALQAALAQVGYPASRLQAERADVRALEAADVTQEQRKAEAKARVAAQRAALAQLDDWLARFTGLAVPALRDRPDLLGQLGLKPRGGPRRA